MVSTRKLVYDFRRKYNSINSGKNQDISLVDIIAYLNEAQQLWFENRVFVSQTNQNVRNDLRTWKEDLISLTLTPYKDGVHLAEYPSDLYHRLDQIAVTTKDCCPGIAKKIIPRIIESDDLYEALRDPYRKPDFFFEQLVAIESKDGILIYHMDEMDINEVIIDYYKNPKELHCPSLENTNGNYYYDYAGQIITADQNFESSDVYSANDIVDIAVLSASRDVGDIQGFQTKLNIILQKQQLYK